MIQKATANKRAIGISSAARREHIANWRKLDIAWKCFGWIIDIGSVPNREELAIALNAYAELLASDPGAAPTLPPQVARHISSLISPVPKGKRGQGSLTFEKLATRQKAVRIYMKMKRNRRAPKKAIDRLAKALRMGRKAFESIRNAFPLPGE